MINDYNFKCNKTEISSFSHSLITGMVAITNYKKSKRPSKKIQIFLMEIALRNFTSVQAQKERL